jgi:hypothetical protein
VSLGNLHLRPDEYSEREVVWRRAHDFSIEIDSGAGAWHAGHVTSILPATPVLVVGTNKGGVWLLTHRPDAIPRSSDWEALPLSFDWDDPNINSLAWGPDGRQHVYVGCRGGALYLIRLDPVAGGFNYVDSSAVQGPAGGGINALLLEPSSRRLVAGTDYGLWWSTIPADPADAASYSWHNVPVPTGSPASWRSLAFYTDATISGLAAGPGGAVLVAVSGPDSPGWLFRGDWTDVGLDLKRAKIPNLSFGSFLNTSIASCGTNRQSAWAMTTFDSEHVGAILHTANGGENWTQLALPEAALVPPVPGGEHALSGHALWYCNCIAASPADPNLVAVGWTSGPFFGRLNGDSMAWTLPTDNVNTPHLHADLHALEFSGSPSDPNLLYVGTDGGVSYTDDLGGSYRSDYNRHLTNLEFYGNDLGVSDVEPGLFGGGTQDNGNVFGDAVATRKLREPEGGDGGAVRFLANRSVVRWWNGQPQVVVSAWDPVAGWFSSQASVVSAAGAGGAGLTMPVFDPVRSPSFKDARGRLMYACAGSGSGVYGLFAATDGTQAEFDLLATIAGAAMTSVASADGSAVVAGTTDGRIFFVDSATGSVTETDMTMAAVPGASIDRLVWVDRDQHYALAQGHVLRFTGLPGWEPLSGGPDGACRAIDVARRQHRRGLFNLRLGGRLFAATDSAVFVSDDDGTTWTDASAGLPRTPHVSDIRVAAHENGEQWVYLASDGWGVWRAEVDDVRVTHHVAELTPHQIEILFGIINDGGGVGVTPSGHGVHVPPRQPVREILTALVILELSAYLPGNEHATIRKSSLTAISNVAAIELGPKLRARSSLNRERFESAPPSRRAELTRQERQVLDTWQPSAPSTIEREPFGLDGSVVPEVPGGQDG